MIAAGASGASRADRHRLDLDGLRGLAIALVLTEHTAFSGSQYVLPFTPAMVGVTVFFVLSGYLITDLLIREDPIDVRNFYLRRVVRLAPALVIVVVAIAALGIASQSDWVPGAVATLIYVSNWAQVAGVDTGLLQHTWSLSIEEQFYVLWPLTLVLVPRRFLLPLAIGLGIAGCTLYALKIGPVFHSTLTNGGAILVGCAAALGGWRLPRLAGLLGTAMIVVGALFASHTLGVIGAVLVVIAPIGALLPLAWLGRRAYAVYLWSWPLVVLLGGPIALPAALVAAEVSYRFVERPIRDRWHPRLAARTPSPTQIMVGAAAKS
jgi:peptidoglycan/LPS O-acetylase OafA/YrhL